MKKTNFILALALCTLLPISSYADKNTKAAENKMVSACKKEYSSAVKGLGTKEISDWVKNEETGANADAFKKSKCYSFHEDWEKASNKMEESETY